ncbi:hypothetical protein HPP92_025301 [Vanilla planifolia]|uniref:Uncharacterized protein n=1 Tax=Vanilla planifolia TaxID=51239 RepID=A0A835UA28_VANPL|nr:hypothetical protein HPP92_025301 [Vanilla planifolia]
MIAPQSRSANPIVAASAYPLIMERPTPLQDEEDKDEDDDDDDHDDHHNNNNDNNNNHIPNP